MKHIYGICLIVYQGKSFPTLEIHSFFRYNDN